VWARAGVETFAPEVPIFQPESEVKVQALDKRRSKLLSEIGTINEQISTLRTKIAEDPAVFRQ
jgi:hypothetical protein